MKDAIRLVKERIGLLEQDLSYAENNLKECMKNTRNAEIRCMKISTSLEENKVILAKLESEYNSQKVMCVDDTESGSEKT